MTTLALDVYGTLIDTAGVTGALEKMLGSGTVTPAQFAAQWRQKQLEYTFRYGLMGHYQNFRVCTRQALDFCCAENHADLPDNTREELMAQYLKLPTFPDVPDSLAQLSQAGIKLFAFSNGLPDDIEKLLTHAGIRQHITDIVSVDEIKTFKPDPKIYRHFLKRAAAQADECWLISGNSFDVCGAAAIGMRTVWLRRTPETVFDPWNFAAEREATSFAQVAAFVGAGVGGGAGMTG